MIYMDLSLSVLCQDMPSLSQQRLLCMYRPYMSWHQGNAAVAVMHDQYMYFSVCALSGYANLAAVAPAVYVLPVHDCLVPRSNARQHCCRAIPS